jgi:hypothetical protein
MRSHLHGMPLPLILRTTFCLILNGNHLAAQILSTAEQWAAGREVIALGDGTMVARWTAQCHRDEVFFCTSDLCFFLPDFCYSYGFLKLVVVGCTESSTTCRYPQGLGKINFSLQSGCILGTYIISD